MALPPPLDSGGEGKQRARKRGQERAGTPPRAARASLATPSDIARPILTPHTKTRRKTMTHMTTAKTAQAAVHRQILTTCV